MTDKDISYLKSIETIENTYPPAKGFCDPEKTNGTSPDKVIIAQNNLIIELLIQIQNLLLHYVSSSQHSVSMTVLEGLQNSLQTSQISAASILRLKLLLESLLLRQTQKNLSVNIKNVMATSSSSRNSEIESVSTSSNVIRKYST